MDIPYIDKRSKQDIIDYIKRVSKTYTPEWNFDTNNPDVGSALALIYSNMYYETVKRFNKVAKKSMFDFFNSINIEMLSATSSEGYVSFQLSSENLKKNIEVPAKTQLIATQNNKQILFQTLEDILVTNSKIQYMYISNGYNDLIRKLYERTSQQDTIFNVELFDTSNIDNIQQHIVEIYHKDVFNITTNAYVGIKFIKMENDNENINLILEDAINSKELIFQYYSTDGYKNFDKIAVLNDSIIAYKNNNLPFKDTFTDGSFKVRLISNQVDLLNDKSFKRLECFSQNKNIIPDIVMTNDFEKNVNQLYPFDEKPLLYDEFYIASQDAFCKKDATIEISFYTDFKKVPIEDEPSTEKEIEYKLIMKHSQFKPEVEYDITIDTVIWEYFNGNGWARLFKDNQYEDIFHPKNGRKTKTISFICPSDMTTITVGSKECYFIRAKILKMNNRFKTKGNFIVPLISEISINYYYNNNVVPNKITCLNNTQTDIFHDIDFNSIETTIQPFKYLNTKHSEIYLGFNNPLEYGPIKFLFCMKDNVSFETTKLKWSYFSNDTWKPLTIFDETNNFQKTGIVTLMGNMNFQLTNIFGKTAYWIKISDFQNEYTKKMDFLPVLNEVHTNSVNVVNIIDMPEETFSIEPFEENKICKLSANMIYKVEVWINEISELTNNEIEVLQSKGLIDIVYDIFGIPVSMWVKWQEVNDLTFSSPTDRHFKVYKNDGIVVFGNNIHGKIPPYKDTQTIKIKYSVGGGKDGNVPKKSINKINKTLGFVTDVYNPLSTYGGSDIETVEQAMRRTSAKLRNCNRAVTTFDYETLAREVERNILKIKCISNISPDGNKSLGSIVLVVLTEDYNKDQNYFISIKEKIEKYISTKMSENIYQARALHIIQPTYIYYSVKAEISLKSFKNVFEIKSQVENTINEFLDVNTGNFNHKGWDIGVLANSTQILNVIKNIKGISYIKSLIITPYMYINSHMVKIDIASLKVKDFSLALSGTHDIIITVE